MYWKLSLPLGNYSRKPRTWCFLPLYAWLLIRNPKYYILLLISVFPVCSLKHKFLITTLIKDCYISPEMFGKLIYDNFIFDVPKMMDLCVLFGPTNSVLLSKMFKNIFVNQPKYKYDLEETAKGLIQVWNILLLLTANVTSFILLSGFSTHFRSTWSREQSSCWKHSLWAIVSWGAWWTRRLYPGYCGNSMVFHWHISGSSAITHRCKYPKSVCFLITF